MRRSLRCIVVILAASCSSAKDATPKADTTVSSAPKIIGAAPGAPTCPATGLWAECSVLYRLDRSGIAPHPDSVDKPEEKALRGKPMVIKFGLNSRLELFIYPDSAARIADGAKLDRTKLINGTAPQTIARERTLIENANVIGLLTSLNERLRERVSDALTAGPPQPPSKK